TACCLRGGQCESLPGWRLLGATPWLSPRRFIAARAGQRADALAMAEEARRAARRLPPAVPPGRLFAISPAAVDLYTVGVHWALGDAGAALEAGKNLRPEQFPTAERRARLGADVARAWWAWRRPEQTARALLDAYRASPGEVCDRPAIRRIVTELTDRHSQVAEVRALHTAVTRARSHPQGGRRERGRGPEQQILTVPSTRTSALILSKPPAGTRVFRARRTWSVSCRCGYEESLEPAGCGQTQLARGEPQLAADLRSGFRRRSLSGPGCFSRVHQYGEKRSCSWPGPAKSGGWSATTARRRLGAGLDVAAV
ncbi:hypothetical protein ABT300_42260, partial [Streptomyces sp. NPDC001027]